MTSSNKDFWEEKYRAWQRPKTPPNPNQALVEVVEELELTPRRALDLVAGHGGDSLWLAKRGWHVMALDISEIAVSRVRALAVSNHLQSRLQVAQCDLTEELPGDPFDFVVAGFFHTPHDIPRPRILADAAELIVPGGHLMILDHGTIPPWSGAKITPATPAETLATLQLPEQQWEPVILEPREREATGPAGEKATVTDNVIVMQRRG